MTRLKFRHIITFWKFLYLYIIRYIIALEYYIETILHVQISQIC